MDRLAVAREIIRQTMENNNSKTTDDRETYADGFGQGLAFAIGEIDTVSEDIEPLGYDVIMDLTHRLVAHVRKGELDDARALNDIMRKLEHFYTEAAELIAKRWGPRE